MQYVLLLYADEPERRDAGDVEAERSGDARREARAFTAELRRRGSHVLSQAFEHSTSATTVRRRDGKTLLSDGPVAAGREQLHGIVLVEAGNLDEAISLAERAPDARIGAVEIRPVRESS